MKRQTPDEYHQWIAELRKAKKLHTAVEDRLIELVKRIAPDYHCIKEPVGLAGGRNDLMLFEFSGRKVLFEILATRSQVSRDLRILDKTDADIKIAVVIDKEVDKTVFEAFVKENPEDNYPFLFIGELFEEPPIICSLRLRELVLGDEEAKFLRWLRTKIPKEDFFTTCRNEGIEVLAKDDIPARDVTFTKVFVTLVLGKCLKYGMARERVKNLGQWLSNEDVIESMFRKISAGMNVFLYTDLIETFAIYSDIELTDWLRISYQLPQPFVILSLNAIIHEIDEKYLKGEAKILNGQEPSIELGLSQVHETKMGKSVFLSLPKNTKAIMMIPPMDDDKEPEDYLELVQVLPSSLVFIRVGTDE